MNNILENWVNDLPEQFLYKNNIDILIKAFAKQLQEINDVFETMEELTGIEMAVGKNLDYLGSIIPMSRKDATAILRKARDEKLTDEFYRNVLRYQNLRNTCSCTYEDIMGSIRVLWNTDSISYREDASHPATIYFDITDVPIDSEDPAKNRVLAVKPAGVSTFYSYAMNYSEKLSAIEQILISADLKTKIRETLFYPVNYLSGIYSMNGTLVMNSDDPIVPVVYAYRLGTSIKTEEQIKGYCYIDGELEEL